MSDTQYWLGFTLIPGIGPKRLLRLREGFGALAEAWRASEADLRQCGLDEPSLTHILRHRARIQPAAEMERVQRAGARLITLEDADYPELLRQIDDPPAVLYVRGMMTALDERALAIVGTRKATRYGLDVTRDIARELARHGITVLSGLALGIDAAAHGAAIDGGGRTLAVMGCGVDVVYPLENADLHRQIMRQGAVVSEFALGAQPTPANFPRRNRILSGLALGVLVVEAPKGSGALITASLAADQGREVFAVPGSIYSPNSYGPNHLIQDGAKLVMSVDDILAEFQIVQDRREMRGKAERIAPSSPDEAHILNLMENEPIHIDDLARLSGMSVAQITGMLTILELKGLIQVVGPMQYRLTH